MRLQPRQAEFTRNISRLIRTAFALEGVELTLGRAYASEAANKADKGIRGSMHTHRLAVDFNLFVDGEYITGSHPIWYALGRYWKSLNRDLARWGGDFRKRDFNHFSYTYKGKQ